MDSRVDFDINDALKHYSIDPASVVTPEAPAELVDCENEPEALTPALINSVLNPVVDAVAQSPEAITRCAVFDTIQFLLKCVPVLPAHHQTYEQAPDCKLFRLSRTSAQIPLSTLSKILDLLTSALAAEADATRADLDVNDEESVPHHKQLLEVFAFLLQWTISAVETRAVEKSAAAPPRGRGKAPKTKKDDTWDSSGQLQKALDAMAVVMGLKLSRVFVTTAERDTLVSMFTKPVYHILENEARVKDAEVQKRCFKVLCLAVKHHGHAFAAQTAIGQSLTYFEHLSEPMAEFLFILADKYDYPQLTTAVLEDLANKEFNPNDLKGPKSVSAFLVRISERTPHLVGSQLATLALLLNKESYTLRCALIEVLGNVIIMHTKQLGDDRDEDHRTGIKVLFEELENRFRDINPYCRCRSMQVLMKIWDLEEQFRPERLTFAELAAQSLQDKSSHVRRNAIKLLAKMVATHPYDKLFNRRLSRTEWWNVKETVKAKITEVNEEMASEEQQEGQDGDETMEMTMAPGDARGTQKQPHEMSDEEKIAFMKKLQRKAENDQKLERLEQELKYVEDVLRFIKQVETGADHVTLLLSSKNKSEVIDAMDFFKIIDAYSVENARTGIRRMLRLIWSKGNSDEGKGIQTHLIDCYKTLFFDAPPHYSPSDAAKYIASNMISLTYGGTPAELTSLEQLLSTMMQQGSIKAPVIQKLWEFYGSQQKGTTRSRRRGAIIVLGMLALADPSIIQAEMQTCLDIGLGPRGRRDLGLARYTCVALKRISPASSKQSPGAPARAPVKLPNHHEVLKRLAAITMLVTEHKDYFGVAEQAIGAIYVLSTHPDVLCSEIIREKTKVVFGAQAQQQQREAAKSAAMDHDGDTEMGDIGMEDAPPADAPAEADPLAKRQNSAFALSQLLFLVGHVAIKQIVHLELCEQEFKRRKAENEKKAAPRQSTAPESAAPAKRSRKKATDKNPTPAAEEADELDLMAGTSEDVITDQMNAIREQQLLDPERALLGQFGPLVKEICSNNLAYNHPTLQAQAALCLAKLMCVSYNYCAENLTLLLTILQRSKDPVVRSNLVIAFGDIAVSFNQLIDQNTEFLYDRLSDSDPSVKRTCLMTLTFLILASQIKVKGQLGVMAKCLEDSDKRIADMTRMFFAELATKDNQVYNHFTDMFSILSDDKELDEDAFKRIVKFLAGFVEKERQAKTLAAKLAQRLKKAENQKQWNQVSYTIGLLQHKDEEIQKQIAEGFQIVQSEA